MCLLIYNNLFFLSVKISVYHFLSARLHVCTFVLLWLLSALFMSQDDEIRAVYGSIFPSITAAVAACGFVAQEQQLHTSGALLSPVAG